MTISDIYKAFKVTLDKNAQAISFGGCPAFLDEEIALFLNQAYIEVLSNKFTGTNYRQEGFEGSVKRIADLEKLVKTDFAVVLTLESGSNVLTVGDFQNASGVNKRMFYITSVLHFNTNAATTCVLTDHEIARKFLKTYNNDPWIDTPIATLQDNTLKVYVDDHKMKSPYNIDITYIKFPDKIDPSTPSAIINEVPDRVLYEVINRAAVIALENIESKRSETKLQINNLQE